MQTLLEDKRVNARILTDLDISGENGQQTIQLPKVYTQDKMPVSLEEVVTKLDIENGHIWVTSTYKTVKKSLVKLDYS